MAEFIFQTSCCQVNNQFQINSNLSVLKIHLIFRFIKIVGIRNTANRIFHLVSMEVKYTLDKYELFNELIGFYRLTCLSKRLY